MQNNSTVLSPNPLSFSEKEGHASKPLLSQSETSPSLGS